MMKIESIALISNYIPETFEDAVKLGVMAKTGDIYHCPNTTFGENKVWKVISQGGMDVEWGNYDN
jgi:hypothetical protein